MHSTCSGCGCIISEWELFDYDGLCILCYSRMRMMPRSTNKKTVNQVIQDTRSSIESDRLPDTEQWINRIRIKSETSNREYIVAQNRVGRYWSCSCPGCITRQNCKHLQQMGLPGHMTPFEPQSKRNDFLGKYKTYDGPKGNPSDWKKAFEKVVGPKENEGERVIIFDDDE